MSKTHFSPLNPEHSIREAVISIFLVHAKIGFDEGFFKLVTDELKPNLSFVRELKNRKIHLLADRVEQESDTVRGVQFCDRDFSTEKLNDGTIFQILDQEARVQVSLHEFNYQRWSDFRGEFSLILNKTKEILPGQVSGVSISYIDDFIIEEDEFVISQIIDENNRYFPKITLEQKVLKSMTTSEKIINGKNGLENVDLGLISINDTTGIRLSHSAYMPIEEQSMNDLLASDFLSLLDSLHEMNKDFLRNTLSDEAQKMIKLDQNI